MPALSARMQRTLSETIKYSDRIPRHNAIRDVVYSAAQSAALCPQKEVPSLIAGSRSRPADIYLPNLEGGQPAAMDVTVISPLQRLTLSSASSVAGHAMPGSQSYLPPPRCGDPGRLEPGATTSHQTNQCPASTSFGYLQS